MAVLNPFMIKTYENVVAGTLEADTGKSLLVHDIKVVSRSDSFLSVKIDKTMAGYFAADNDRIGSHVPYATAAGKQPVQTVLEYFGKLGVFGGYPIAEGQKMTLSGMATPGVTGSIIYSEYEAGDITETMQNGTEADDYFLLNYGDAGANLSTAGEHLIDNQVSPKDFPEFPFGKVVPARKEIDVHAILASERAADNGAGPANYIRSTHYKLKQERATLFDEDVKGIYAQGLNVANTGAFEIENGYSVLGEGTDRGSRPIYPFTPPLTFGEGEELNVYETTEVAGTPGSFLTEETRIALAMTVRKVA